MATVKKYQKSGPPLKKSTPTYKNLRMGVKNENYLMSGENRDIKPSSKDSARYRGGFEQGLKGMKGMPNEGQVEKMGRWEGQNVGKKSGVVKKAKKGGSFDLNKDGKTTFKDVLIGRGVLPKTAKKGGSMKKSMSMGGMMKKGGKMTKTCKYGCK